MLRKLIIAAAGALGLVTAVGCERDEGRSPGGTPSERRDRPTTTPPPAETPPREPAPEPPR